MKKQIALLLAVLMIFSLTACGANQETDETATLSKTEQTIPAHVSLQAEKNGQRLKVDADVMHPDSIPKAKVILIQDDDAVQRLYDYLIPDPSQDGKEDEQGNLVGQFFQNGEQFQGAGSLYYGDCRIMDRNDKDLDEGKAFEPYITSIQPGSYQKTALEVAEQLNDFLADYTCFSMKPATICAHEGRDGAYDIYDLTLFEGRYMLGRDLGSLSAYVRESGIEAIQGEFLLKESHRIPLETRVPFQDILSKLQEDFSDYTFRETVTIQAIDSCYLAVPYRDTWELHPVWAFLGEASGGYTAPHDDWPERSPAPITYLYDMDTGVLNVLDANFISRYY